jgi:hypothetical protein
MKDKIVEYFSAIGYGNQPFENELTSLYYDFDQWSDELKLFTRLTIARNNYYKQSCRHVSITSFGCYFYDPIILEFIADVIPIDYVAILAGDSTPSKNASFLLIHKTDISKPVLHFTRLYLKKYGIMTYYDSFERMLDTSLHLLSTKQVIPTGGRLFTPSLEEIRKTEAGMNPSAVFFKTDFSDFQIDWNVFND